MLAPRYTVFILVPLLLFLSACFEDKGAVLAQCKLAADKRLDQEKAVLTYQEYIITCMRARGYDLLTSTGETCRDHFISIDKVFTAFTDERCYWAAWISALPR